MKILGVFALLLLVGCGSMPSMQQLEQQAFLSGDWTAVEKRERSLLRRKQRSLVQCPAGQIAICEGHMRIERCSCMRSGALRSILAGY